MYEVFSFISYLPPKEGVLLPLFSDGLVLYKSLTVASAPYVAVGKNVQPLRIWAKSYDVF